MMAQQVLSHEQRKQHEVMHELLLSCKALAAQVSDEEGVRIVKERINQLQSAAMLVIVGEVKSGKSSFVNALLGEEVCEVAPDPCTSGIQELVYGEKRITTNLGVHWERLALPKEVLRKITIVDTPGTNSIIRDHQTITEKYIPQSDIIVFVFSAKNPHTGSAWEFLSLIKKDWHRKIVFILQQSDLASPRELEINEERVHQYARERNVQNPVVFSLSAKLESERASGSGFGRFREYLSEAIQSGEIWRMKVEGVRDTAGKIAGRILDRLHMEQAGLEEDRSFYNELYGKVTARREKAKALKRLAVDSLSLAYDRLANGLEQDFAEGLRAGTILRRSVPVLRDKDVKTWLSELQAKFEAATKKEIEAESMRVSKDISDEMTSMFNELTEAIDHRHQKFSYSISRNDPDRAEILTRLQQQLRDLRLADISENKGAEGLGLSRLSLTGGGLAALGAVIALASNLMIFDITGGILALVGASMIAVTLIWKRSGILNEFSGKMKKSREEFRQRLDAEIGRMFDKLFLEIEHRMKEPVMLIDEKNKHLQPLIQEAGRVIKLAEDLRTEY